MKVILKKKPSLSPFLPSIKWLNFLLKLNDEFFGNKKSYFVKVCSWFIPMLQQDKKRWTKASLFWRRSIGKHSGNLLFACVSLTVVLWAAITQCVFKYTKLFRKYCPMQVRGGGTRKLTKHWKCFHFKPECTYPRDLIGFNRIT